MKSFIVTIVLISISIELCSSHGGHGNHPQKDSYQGKDQIKTNINIDHVMEHLDGVINKPKEEMSAEEQNFYYFKLHDYDNNNKLDGIELVSAFAHNDGKYIFRFHY
jgi:hypothetical protein